MRVSPSGEVLVREPGLFQEYYKNPQATAETLDAEGWFHTGDAGFFDKDGHLKIIDRAKDVGRLAERRRFRAQVPREQAQVLPLHQGGGVRWATGRDVVCAFINIDLVSVGNWAERRGLAYTGYTDLPRSPRSTS